MAYVVLDEQKRMRRPYRVEYLHHRKPCFRKFATLRQAESFRRRLPMGASSKIKLLGAKPCI